MTEKMTEPAIRFVGFTGAWEQRKLGDLLQYEQPTKYIVESTDYDDSYEIPVLTAGQSFVLGYTDEESGIKEASKDDPIIIFDDFTTTSHFVDFPFKVKSSAMKLLALKDRQSDFYFVFRGLENFDYHPQNHERHWISKFVSFDLSVPAWREQKQIGSFFRAVDDLITLHQRKYEKLITFKKAMLEKMVPKEGSTVPEIRFAGFADAWEQREFSRLVVPYTDPVMTPSDGYYRLGLRSHAKGTFHSYVRPGMELETAQMYRVAADNFIVNITFAWEHAVAVTTENDAGRLVSHRFPQFSFVDGIVPAFLKYLILDEEFRHHLWLSSPGGAGRNRVLKISEMLEYKFWVTSDAEQRKIAEFMMWLDNLITLHQRKLEKLKNFKKAFLEKMFV